MSSDSNPPPAGLPPALLQALNRSIETTAGSLDGMCTAVQAYTKSQKSKNASLEDIVRNVSSIVVHLEGRRSALNLTPAHGDGELRRKLAEWCEEAYNES